MASPHQSSPLPVHKERCGALTPTVFKATRSAASVVCGGRRRHGAGRFR